jgi:hypothetical protein
MFQKRKRISYLAGGQLASVGLCFNYVVPSLMFIPCIFRRIRNDQQYALICNIPLFYVLAPTCFGSSMPTSGSFLDPSELLEIQIEWVVCHIMCGYVACVPDCCCVVRCASQLSALSWDAQRTTQQQSGTQAT